MDHSGNVVDVGFPSHMYKNMNSIVAIIAY